MKDKEKARKIVDNIFSTGVNTHVSYYEMAYDSAIRMAEWKEKEMLDCAVSAYCECCDTKECEDYLGGECNWKLNFEKKLLKNLKK